MIHERQRRAPSWVTLAVIGLVVLTIVVGAAIGLVVQEQNQHRVDTLNDNLVEQLVG